MRLLALLITVPALHAAVALHCGSLLDPATDQVVKDIWVLTSEGKVLQITATRSGFPKDTETIDLSKSFCLPGLIDVHTHLTSDPTDEGYSSLGISVPMEAIKGVKNARRTLMAGFTT